MTTTIESLTAAFEAERRDARPPVSADDLPLSYEAITPEWLTSVLCRQSPGARVVSFRLGPADDGNSNRRRVFLEYDDHPASSALPRQVFCKATHGLANRISLGLPGAIQCEVNFYNLVRPLLSVEIPVCEHARYNAALNSIVVLRDLGPGTTFCNHTTRVDRDLALRQMDLLAAVHGQFLDVAELDTTLAVFPTWPEFFGRLDYPDFENACDAGFAMAREVIPARLLARRKAIWPATRKSVERHRHLPRTLTHGDVHLRNWYITGQGRPGLTDWQAVTRGHWSRDVIYAISTALSIEDRRAWDRELIRHYVEQLSRASGRPVSFDDAWLACRQQLFTALAFWTITLNPAPGMPDMQPRDSTLEFIRRLAHAIDDHDALDSF
jgi:aminoglycoside/choline kinase family phosphotransferase